MRWKRVVAGGAAVVGLGVLGLGGLLAWTFSGMGAIEDGSALPGGGVVVQDGYTSLTLLPLAEDRFALIDAGNDKSGAAVLAALRARGAGPENVVAVLLTHGHPDHTGACALFPDATTYVLDAEVPMVAGEVGAHGPVTRWFPPADSGCAHVVGLRDDAEVDLGGTTARILAVPGHTAGSAAWRVGPAVFLGDSADAAADGSLLPAKWMFTDDPGANADALRRLAERLQVDAPEVLVCAHSGALEPSALQRWARER